MWSYHTYCFWNSLSFKNTNPFWHWNFISFKIIYFTISCKTPTEKSFQFYLSDCPVVSVAGTKHHDQMKIIKERVHLAYTSILLSIIGGAMANTQTKQGPGGRTYTKAMKGFFLLACL